MDTLWRRKRIDEYSFCDADSQRDRKRAELDHLWNVCECHAWCFSA